MDVKNVVQKHLIQQKIREELEGKFWTTRIVGRSISDLQCNKKTVALSIFCIMLKRRFHYVNYNKRQQEPDAEFCVAGNENLFPISCNFSCRHVC